MRLHSVQYFVASVIVTYLFVATAHAGGPSGSAFTYQGQFKRSGLPVTDTCDFAFSLWDGDNDPNPGTQIGSAIPLTTEVVNGLFQVDLDFGSAAFDGDSRWLQIDVCCPSPCQPAFVTLTPRMAVAPAPYALHALNNTCSCVATIQDLRALRVPATGREFCARVLGYWTPGDGGGGDFFWDAAATASDNGGTVIGSDSNPPTGKWKRQVDGPLSVKWFGAKGDDSTDDQAAIQSALDSGFAHIVIPAGVYRLSTMDTTCSLCPTTRVLCRTFLTVPNTVKLIEGPGTLSQGVYFPNILKVCNSDELTIKDVSFLGIKTKESRSDNSGIYAVNCSNLTITNCTFDGLANQAIAVTGTPERYSEHIKILNNSCLDSATGISLTKCRFATIHGNLIQASPQMTSFTTGITLTSTAALFPISSESVCKHVIISNNVVSGYRRGVQSIFMHAGEDVIITGNQVLDALLGITANPHPDGPDVVRNIQITNNLVVGTTDLPAGADTSGNCIGVGGNSSKIPTGVLIAGNTVVGCNKGRNPLQGGIAIGYSDRVTVRGNQVLDCYGVGIAINNPSTRLVVTDNTIENTQGPSSAGIRVRTGPGTSGRIANNVINGNNNHASGGIRLDCPDTGRSDCGLPASGCTSAYPGLIIGRNDIVNVDNFYYCGQDKATFDAPINRAGRIMIQSPAQSGGVVFPSNRKEPDGFYRVAAMVSDHAGCSFSIPQVARVTDKTNARFFVHLTDALDGECKVWVDWILSRDEPTVPCTCDDGNPCTSDMCVDGNCTFTDVLMGTECNDSLFCTVSACDRSGKCVITGSSCTDTEICCEWLDLCIPLGQCIDQPAGTPCRDCLFCNGQDECDGSRACIPTGNPCPSETDCREYVKQCVPRNQCFDNRDDPSPLRNGTPCHGDSLFCTADVCDGAGNCTVGISPCPPTDICCESTAQCLPQWQTCPP